MNHDAKIFVAGHGGMVGSALVRRLRASAYSNIVYKTRMELNLLDQRAVHQYLSESKPDYIFIAAARVGGIHANNTRRAEFLYENLAITSNLVHGAHLAGTQNLMFLGSSCIYPKYAVQPITEDALLTGPLESTNEPYAIAKIAGLKLCEAYNAQYGRNYVCAMPTNLYGPNDNYDLNNSHVLPALLRKAHEAKIDQADELVVWGSGNPLREFLHVDDLADACVFLMESGYQGPLINVGSGQEVTIRELAELIMNVVGYRGKIRYDDSKPDGTPRKLLDISRLRALGWAAKIPLPEGIANTYSSVPSFSGEPRSSSLSS